MSTITHFDADVAIIGYGPSGLAAALCLGHCGIRTIALERDQAIYPRARAVTVNDWTMRCFQSLGLDEELARTMDPTVALRWITHEGHRSRARTSPLRVWGGTPRPTPSTSPRWKRCCAARTNAMPSTLTCVTVWR
jgi:3-(3-hydroxy-phenyl)propionate hydroxylase